MYKKRELFVEGERAKMLRSLRDKRPSVRVTLQADQLTPLCIAAFNMMGVSNDFDEYYYPTAGQLRALLGRK